MEILCVGVGVVYIRRDEFSLVEYIEGERESEVKYWGIFVFKL